MYSIRLNWTPSTTAVGQEVFYREVGTTTWNTVAVVSAVLDTYVVTGLTVGTEYEFKIDTYCLSGGRTPGTPVRPVLPCSPPTALTAELESM